MTGTALDAQEDAGAAAPGATPRWREVAAGRLGLTVGLCLVELLAGMQMLIVSTTMPRVLDDIGGLAFYGWVFSGYSLAGLAAIPRAGREADRRGPLRPLAELMGVFALGTLLCGLAPSMALLALARVVQGYGGGGLYTVAYGVVAKAYPERVRARIVALLTLVWVVSGLVGPGVGVALATTVGWRWAFLVNLPLVAAAAALVLPAVRGHGADAQPGPRLPVRWPLQLTVGVALLVGGLSSVAWWTPVLAVAGTAVAVQALRRLLPPGTFRARPGLPAAVALTFLSSLGFFTADSYVTLLLTGVGGRSVGEAGVAVTLVSLSWCASSWWQSHAVATIPTARLVAIGSALLSGGVAGTAAALAGAPLWLVYTAWLVAGLGMGIVFPTLLLASMGSAETGSEGSVVAARSIGGRLGMALGAGLGGCSVGLAAAAGGSLRAGLAGTFGLALGTSLLTLALAPRLAPVRMKAGARG